MQFPWQAATKLVGKTLGHYEILEPLGKGGMGEVYRARDTKLDRDVAIKVLPSGVADDPERLSRLEREAHLLAAVNHPNIASIYSLDESDEIRFLVLELAHGQTLDQRLSRRPLEVDETLRIAGRIAEALEAAHERGIIHRDLKPANIMVTPSGGVKVLDFGLAKVHETQRSGSGSLDIPSQTPTAVGGTDPGRFLGTAAYMSPEQARGLELDKRADIWSFGCVLFEMLAGRRCFVGDTVSDTLAAILKEEPDWSALPDHLPARIKYLVRRSLSKDPHDRLRDIGDARIEIQETLTGALDDYPSPSSTLDVLPRRFALASRPEEGLIAGATTQPSVSLSPDGSRLAYVASWDGRRQLFLRPFNELEAAPIFGTEGAAGPFFSPDGQSVAFFAAGKLKQVSLKGGAPVTLADAPLPRGGTWGPEDTILYCPSPGTGL